ncbi:hypothetical protein F4604DRAFT_1917521 [Suillus subluteus]|nr:hypothetical protein F4604DRAFT_1917521 [Suillus subluteus]
MSVKLTDSIYEKAKKCRSDKHSKKTKWLHIEDSDEIIHDGIEQVYDDIWADSPDMPLVNDNAVPGLSQIPDNDIPAEYDVTPVISHRSGRTIQMPRHYVDYLPGSATHLTHMLGTNHQRHDDRPQAATLGLQPAAIVNSAVNCPQSPSPSPSIEPTLVPFETKLDNMGLYCIYPTHPTLVPTDGTTLNTVMDAPTLDCSQPGSKCMKILAGLLSTDVGIDKLFDAFTNPMCGLLMAWQYAEIGLNSAAHFDHLSTFLDNPLFHQKDAVGITHAHELKLLHKYLDDKSNPFQEIYGWHESTVRIHLPKEKQKWASEEDAPELEIPGVYHHSLVDVITARKRPSRSSQKLEAHSSPAMLEAYEEINALPHEPGDNLKRVVTSLMFWSDATHLTNFVDASIACHHIAYIPTLPSDFQETYIGMFGEPSTDQTYTFCKRELMHAIWRLLLDDKFMDAYEHGIVIKCSDGITRRVFPQFFTYSADYPEKILLASIKFLGQCPCPHCLVKKANVPKMGMKARSLIFKKGAPVSGTWVNNLLNDESLVPTQNTFSEKLAKFGFNLFVLFVVDLLHEFEIGVWKAIFTHLIRILHATTGNSVQDLNEQYRMVPTFGRGTIWCFHSNVSSMKKLACKRL